MKLILVLLSLFAFASCGIQGRVGLCPRHIETPSYPPLARLARMSGKVVVAVTVDANGRVTTVQPEHDGKWVRLLGDAAVENVRHWTFVKPSSAPYVESVVYDYEFDPSLPPAGGPSSLPTITKVTFDLPDHVTIVTNLRILDVSRSAKDR